MKHSASVPGEGGYIFSPARKETPGDFNDFLYSCTLEERVQMLQALKELPGLKDDYFGRLKGLPPIESFSSDKSLKPSSFNEVSPETVIDAMEKGIISNVALGVPAIRKALVWRAYNKSTYLLRSDDKVDYHDIVQWVAKKSKVDAGRVKALPTFELEKAVTEKYFEAIWDKLNYEQRSDLLKNLERESGINFDIPTIAAMGGGAVLGALQAAILAYGLPVLAGNIGYYLVVIVFGSGWLIDILAYLGFAAGWLTGLLSSPLAWAIAGPLGLVVTSTLLAGGLYMMGSAEKETVSAFVMTVGMIKFRRYIEAFMLPARFSR